MAPPWPLRILGPGLWLQEVKANALRAGALGCGISGSGPSIFSLSDGSKTALEIGEKMQETFKNFDIDSEVYISRINRSGPQVLE